MRRQLASGIELAGIRLVTGIDRDETGVRRDDSALLDRSAGTHLAVRAELNSGTEHGSARDDRVTTDVGTRADDRRTPEAAVIAKSGAIGNLDPGAQRRTDPDTHIDPGDDAGLEQTERANAIPRPDDRGRQLRVRIRANDDRLTANRRALTDDRTATENDVVLETGTATDLGPLPDEDAGTDRGPFTNDGTGANNGPRSDDRPALDRGARRDDRGPVYIGLGVHPARRGGQRGRLHAPALAGERKTAAGHRVESLASRQLTVGAERSTVGQRARRPQPRAVAEATVAADRGASPDEGEVADLGAGAELHGVHGGGPLTENDVVTDIRQTGDVRRTGHANPVAESGPGPDHAGTGIDIPKAELHSLGELGSQAAARGRPADQPTPRADDGAAKDAQTLSRRGRRFDTPWPLPIDPPGLSRRS